MDRLSDWRAAAWVAFCLAALAVAAALIVPAVLRHDPKRPAPPVLRAEIAPRTHLFGDRLTATLEIPAGFKVRPHFAPYRVLDRTVTRTGRTVKYRFTLDCLTSRCVGAPGAEHDLSLPPVQLVLPNGRKVIGFWPPLRQASRLGPTDLRSPQLRGDLEPPARATGRSPQRLTGLLLAVAAALALLAAGALGLHWLAWRPRLQWSTNGKQSPSALDYALLVTGLAAGGGYEDRRAALESLAIALDERGLGNLATEARGLAWSPQPPDGESVRRLAAEAQQAARATK